MNVDLDVVRRLVDQGRSIPAVIVRALLERLDRAERASHRDDPSPDGPAGDA